MRKNGKGKVENEEKLKHFNEKVKEESEKRKGKRTKRR